MATSWPTNASQIVPVASTAIPGLMAMVSAEENAVWASNVLQTPTAALRTCLSAVNSTVPAVVV